MAWLRVGDTLFSYPQIIALGALKVPCIGFYVLCYSWAAANPPAKNGDPDLVPVRQARIEALDCPVDVGVMLEALKRVGLIARKTRMHKTWGECYVFVIDDDVLHIRTEEAKKTDRDRDIPSDLALRILARDGDQCRWCGITVNPASRRGGRQRQWDHVDPSLPHSYDNTVVSCSSCNAAKGDQPRPLEQLRRTPVEVYLAEATRLSLQAARLIPRPTDGSPRAARPVDDLRASGTDAIGDYAQQPAPPTQDRSKTDRPPEPGVTRVGQGRDGSGAPAPRSRGGRRHQQPRPP